MPESPTPAAKVLGVQFAPINIPLDRRLQTLAVLFWASSFLGLFNIGGIILFVYLLFTRLYWLPLLYAIWYWLDHKQSERGGRRLHFIRNWTIWKYFAAYFPVKLVKTAELDPNKNYLCGYHPHGIMCAGAFSNFCTEATHFKEIFPDIKPTLLTLVGQFMVPFYRDYIMGCGVCAVSRDSVNWLLTKEGKGNMVIIVIGGAAEALDAHPGKPVRLTLRRRKGFVRIALKTGASLIPIFSFGENDLFSQASNTYGTRLRKVQEILTKKLGVSPPMFHGRGIFQYSLGWLPYRSPIHTVVGKPIDIQQTNNPTEEEVERVHKIYIDILIKLFDEHKVNYDGYKDISLEIA